MVLLVQHVSAPTEVSSSSSSGGIAVCLPAHESESSIAILSPQGRVPNKSSLQHGRLVIDARSTSAVLHDVANEISVENAPGSITVSCVVPTTTSSRSASATSPSSSIISTSHQQQQQQPRQTAAHANYLFVYGGARTTGELHGDALLLNADTGSVTALQRPVVVTTQTTSTTSDGDATTTLASSSWPSPRRHAAACCIYKAAAATTTSSHSAATAGAPADAGKKDPKTATPAKGGAAKTGGNPPSGSSTVGGAAEHENGSVSSGGTPTPTIVMFGGMGEHDALLEDLYTFTVDVDAITHSSASTREGSPSSSSSSLLWTKITPRGGNGGPSPGPRAHHSLTSTSSSSRAILFGGFGYSQSFAAAAAAAAAAASLAPAAPAGKGGHAAAAAAANTHAASVVAFTPPIASLLNDCWVLDCTSWTWTLVNTVPGPIPAPRFRHAAASNAFLPDARTLAMSTGGIPVLGADIRHMLPVYEQYPQLLHGPKQPLPSAAANNNAAAAAAAAVAASDAAKGAKGGAAKGKAAPSAIAPVEGEGDASASSSSIPSFLFEYNPSVVDILFIFGGACSPPELAASFAEARREADGSSTHSSLTTTNTMRPLHATRADDMMDGTVHVLVLDPSLADAVSAAKQAAHESTSHEGSTASPGADAAATTTTKRAFGVWATLPAVTYQMLGGTSVEVSAPEVLEFPIGIDMGESVTSLPGVTVVPTSGAGQSLSSMAASTASMVGNSMVSVGGGEDIPYNGSATPLGNGGSGGGGYTAANGAATTSRPSSRPMSRPSYKAMMRKRNDTFLRRMNATATAFAVSKSGNKNTEESLPASHDYNASIIRGSVIGGLGAGGSIASLPGNSASVSAHHGALSSQPSDEMSYYILLYGGVTDVHVRSAAARVTRRGRGPIDDPALNALLPVGVTLELLTPDALKKRVAAPVSVQHDGYGGVILRERTFDPSRNIWSLEIVRRTYPDGVYEGTSDAGIRTGKGRMDWNYYGGLSSSSLPSSSSSSSLLVNAAAASSCSAYEGEWRNDIPHGRGTMVFADGAVYQGNFVNGLRDGGGVCTWPLASLENHKSLTQAQVEVKEVKEEEGGGGGGAIDGGVDGGHQNGESNIPAAISPSLQVAPPPDELANSSTRVKIRGWSLSSYEGDWKRGLPHGQGTATFTNGAKYVGSFEEGRVQGQGEMTVTLTGNLTNIVNGMWVAGTLHGSALWKKEHEDNGVLETYIGSFSEGVRECADAAVDLEDGSHYRGPYRAGKRNGIGEIRYPNKDVYTGKFVGDKRNGKGTLLKCNGDVYAGLWKDDKEHGEGSYRFASSGEQLVGIWENGRWKERK